MKIIGTLDTRGDGDLLKEVLDQAAPLFDYIYAYDDNSSDNTYEVLKNSSCVSKLWKSSEFSEKEKSRYLQHRRGWLLEQVKKDFPYKKEEIWVVRLEGDRFFMNQSPRDIIDRARKANMDSRSGVMLDFKRHRLEGWGTEDTFPNWHKSIKEIMKWFTIDDVHRVIAFRVCDTIDYAGSNRPRPWPRGYGPNDYNKDILSEEMAFFAHYGRRSPKYMYWSIKEGNRGLSIRPNRVPTEWDMSSPQRVFETVLERYQPYKVFYYTDWESIKYAISMYNNKEFWSNRVLRRYYFWGIEEGFKQALKSKII